MGSRRSFSFLSIPCPRAGAPCRGWICMFLDAHTCGDLFLRLGRPLAGFAIDQSHGTSLTQLLAYSIHLQVEEVSSAVS